ncbi:MAG: AAA family ATPase [Calditrichaeota bacterium]|nr:AAA family ATPase [Calditrichota bacterium]
MFNAVSVGNFKAFGTEQRIPLRPITLVYGANSSGKSSILHSLLFARHAQETDEQQVSVLDTHRTKIGGDSVDLGGFRQFIHQRNPSNTMRWAVELQAASRTSLAASILEKVKLLSVAVDIGLSHIEVTEKRESVDPRTNKRIMVEVPTGRLVPTGNPSVQALLVEGDGLPLVSFTLNPSNKMLQLRSLNHEHAAFREVIEAIVMLSTTTEALHPSDFEGINETIGELTSGVFAECKRLFPRGLSESSAFSPAGQARLFTISRANRREDLADAVRSFMPRTLDELLAGVHESIAAVLSKLVYLGPLRSYPARHLAFTQDHESNWMAGGGYAWDVVRRNKSVRDKVNEWLSDPNRLQTHYELAVRDYVALDDLDEPLTAGLERINDTGIEITGEFDREGNLEGGQPAIKDTELEASKLAELIKNSDAERLNELIMIDKRSSTVVSHRDVGIGVSQVLPVLVYSYAYKDSFIAIEQPEIHLHPAIQADLGDLFIDSALGTNRNNFVIETHSEHLLLRVMRRIRETSQGKLAAEQTPVTPNDVMVLFVEPDGTRSIVREMPLNNQGELVKAWPGGFFEEGLREVF